MDEETLIKAYYTVFKDTDWGQVVLNDLMNKFYKTTFLSRNANEFSIMLNAGGREVVVYILSQIEEYENRGRG